MSKGVPREEGAGFPLGAASSSALQHPETPNDLPADVRPAVPNAPSGSTGATAGATAPTSAAAARSTSTGSGTPRPVGTPAAAGATRPSPAATKGAAPRAPETAGAGGPGPGLPGHPASPPPPAGNSPVLIASVGTLGGPAGTVLKPVVDAVQVWVRYINGRGGLNGHPVQLFVYDDGGDPARQKAQVKEAVEQRHVIAFVQNVMGLSGPGSKDYITSKRIPMIGAGDITWAYDSPMIFPQASSGALVFEPGIWGAAQQTPGKKKLATITCVEVQECRNFDRIARGVAAKAGFELVFSGTASLAQPDFTAECLNARNAGAEVFVVAMDSNSTARVAASCARQGFKPTWGSLATLVAERMKDDPNLQGLVRLDPGLPVVPLRQPGHRRVQGGHGLVRERDHGRSGSGGRMGDGQALREGRGEPARTSDVRGDPGRAVGPAQ